MNLEAFYQSFLALPGQVFAYVDRKWWRYDAGTWTRKGAVVVLDRALESWARDSPDPQIQAKGQRQYLRARMIRDLAPYLATDTLPGRPRDDLQPSEPE